MKIKYELTEDDYLAYQIHASSVSERIQAKKRKQHQFLVIGCIIVALFFFFVGKLFMVVLLVFYAFVAGLFFKKYFDWRYKQHYKAYIKEVYKNRFGIIAELEFAADVIRSKDRIGEGKVKLNEIERVDETDSHLFMKISNGESFIIPKQKIENLTALIDHISSLGIGFHDFQKQNTVTSYGKK